MNEFLSGFLNGAALAFSSVAVSLSLINYRASRAERHMRMMSQKMHEDISNSLHSMFEIRRAPDDEAPTQPRH